ncbi:MAG TPA: tyrosine--tRNA ligase [Anaerolineales bacterium]|nr:tyrosine--tRNA ligase [Anaerolineales bacterium]
MRPQSVDEQTALLMQGTEYGDETLKQSMTQELRQRLVESRETGRPLRVYCGYDPTKPDLHLGHTITMRKLRQFQEFGHDVTFLIGDYTTLVGDPSDKDKLRPRLSSDEIRANAATYAEQAFRILDREKTRIRYNSEWLSTLSFAEVIRLSANFTVQQFLARERFALRVEQGEPVYLHETLYGVMQGYDAVAQEADVQVGGSEQLFNIIVAGRKLQEVFGQRPQVGVLLGILPGTDGVLRMSKSTGNTIEIMSTAEDMYGKVMSLPDAAMPIYFRLVTRFAPGEIEDLEGRVQSGAVHPRDAKMRLAREIVDIYYGGDEAARAEDSFRRVFQEGRAPESIDELVVPLGSSVAAVLETAGWVASRSEARRLIDQGGVTLDGQPVSSSSDIVDLTRPRLLRLGKRRHARLVAKDG